MNRQVRPEMIPQGIDELIEKARHTELQFRWRWRRHGAHLDLRAAAADELFAILGDEVVQHDARRWLGLGRRRCRATRYGGDALQ